jgi:hypothetical protein
MKFLQCFRRPLSTGNSNPNPDPEAPLLPGYQPSCVFCDVSVKKGFAIEYEVGVEWSHEGREADAFQDDELIVFRDRWPRAREHLLVIPRAHVGTVRGLTPADIPLSTSLPLIRHSLLLPC